MLLLLVGGNVRDDSEQEGGQGNEQVHIAPQPSQRLPPKPRLCFVRVILYLRFCHLKSQVPDFGGARGPARRLIPLARAGWNDALGLGKAQPCLLQTCGRGNILLTTSKRAHVALEAQSRQGEPPRPGRHHIHDWVSGQPKTGRRCRPKHKHDY